MPEQQKLESAAALARPRMWYMSNVHGQPYCRYDIDYCVNAARLHGSWSAQIAIAYFTYRRPLTLKVATRLKMGE